MRMNSNLHRAKKALVQALFDLSQKREGRKQAAKEKRETKLKREHEIEFQRRRAAVEVPDTPDAIRIWMEVMGQRPADTITEIRAMHYAGFIYETYVLSFSYCSEDELKETVSQTHWSELSRAIFTEEAEYEPSSYVQQKPIPPWREFWPVQPGAASMFGGIPCVKPFIDDRYCFFFDKENKRVFLSTGWTHAQHSEHIAGIIERGESEHRASTISNP